ncbi:DUF4332 domain-containing protein [Chloroflexota bacterium]
MPVDWDEMQKEMYPIKDYGALGQRWQDAFAYSFVCEAYNFSMPEIADYTQRLLGGDTRNRYTEYSQRLVETFNQLHQASVQDIMDLVTQVDTSEQFEAFTDQTMVHERDAMAALKYLVYWFIPTKKYLSGLVLKDSSMIEIIKALRSLGIRTNLDILQQGLTSVNRKAIAEASKLSELEINELTNWADFSRMPWASKATISNIIGAGYRSIEELANANPEQLHQDFHSYGASIGKNLKFGNEIESSYRIAKIIPLILVE